jgi:hypothetical protein
MGQCRELPAPVPIFETVQECQAELAPAMQKFMNDYPQILANCIEVDPSMEEEDAELVWDINSSGNLIASVESTSGVMVARNEKEDRLPVSTSE